MKTRGGFVSNSSTSSFVLIGFETDKSYEELEEYDDEDTIYDEAVNGPKTPEPEPMFPEEQDDFISLAPESTDFKDWDAVHNVNHYQLFPDLGIQVIDVIRESLDRRELKGFESYAIGNAIKYLLRAGAKDGKLTQDLEKAETYIGYITNPRT